VPNTDSQASDGDVSGGRKHSGDAVSGDSDAGAGESKSLSGPGISATSCISRREGWQAEPFAPIAHGGEKDVTQRDRGGYAAMPPAAARQLTKSDLLRCVRGAAADSDRGCRQ
jgi:hypothetical protein